FTLRSALSCTLFPYTTLFRSCVAAVGGEYHAMYFYIAFGAHRNFGYCCRIAAISHELRDAAMVTRRQWLAPTGFLGCGIEHAQINRKSTRLNSSHVEISYAVF